MQVEQGSGLRQGFEKADAEATEARRPDRSHDVGASAGGDLVHDFSNLATTIVSAANLLQKCGDDPARVAEIARLLRETGERATATLRRLRPAKP